MIRIGELRARYRLPASAREAAARLDRIAREALPDALDDAALRLGLEAEGLLCVRRLEVGVRLSLADADVDLAASWGRAFERSLRAKLDEGGVEVVRFASTRHALVDVVRSLIAGSVDRAWAWERAGFTLGGDVPGALARTLVDEAALAAVVIAEIARAGSLVQLRQRLGASGLRAVALAALAAHGASRAVATTLLDGGPEAEEREARAADRRGIAARVRARSAILAADVGAARPDERRALVALALIEVEPAAVVRRGLLGALMAAMDAPESASTARIGRTEPRPDAPRGGREPSVDAHRSPVVGDEPGREVRRAREAAAGSRVDRDEGARRAAEDRFDARFPGARSKPPSVGTPDPRFETSAPDPRSKAAVEVGPGLAATPGPGTETNVATRNPVSGASKAGASTAPTLTNEDRPTGSTAERSSSSPSPSPPRPELDEAEAVTWLEDRRPAGESEVAGVLFLLHVARELDTFGRLARAPELAGRSTRWSLHRLALALAPAREDDAAALAFAGLVPGSAPPSRDEAPPSADELAWIETESARILERTRDRVAADASVGAIRRMVVPRRARIVADPGWFDVHLDLRDVSTEIRRAGLDLDLNFVPALGAVVRFHYA